MPDLICSWCTSAFADPRAPGTRGRRPGFCSEACRRAKNSDYFAGRSAERRLLEQCVDCPNSQIDDALPGTDFCAKHTARRTATSHRQTLERYGMTADDLAELYVRQDGRCAICKVTEAETGRRHAVDHDHSCCPGDRSCGKCVRGLLCSPCNLGLGNFQDRVDLLEAASEYVTGHRER